MERITPLDLDRANVPVRFRGYDRRVVDELLQRASKEIEQLLGELKRVQSYADTALHELERFRAQEDTLKQAIILAQKVADETRANAHKEADLILEEARRARQEARREAEKAVDDLRYDIERLEREREALRSRVSSVLKEAARVFESDVQPESVHGNGVISLEVQDGVIG